MLATGFVSNFLRGRIRWVILFALLTLGVVTHYHSANYYRTFWAYQRDVWWQLSWRAPGLRDGMVLVVNMPRPHGVAEDYKIWALPISQYHPSEGVRIQGQVLNDGTAGDIMRQTGEDRWMRTICMYRNYASTLVLSIPSPASCSHVINGAQVE